MSAVAQAGAGSVANAAKAQAAKVTGGVKQASTQGARGAITGTGGSISSNATSAAGEAAKSGSDASQIPDWAKKAKSNSNSHRAESAAFHALRGGDSGGASSGPKLKDDE
jgi:type IV secretion system protein TrbL